MVYCKLSKKLKKRSCGITDTKSENSEDCSYNATKNKCYVARKMKNTIPQRDVSVRDKPTQMGKFCKLEIGKSNRRTCIKTSDKTVDSINCTYDNTKHKCYVTKRKKSANKIRPNTLHKAIIPVEQQNIQINNLQLLKKKVEYEKWVKTIFKDRFFNIERTKPTKDSIPIMNEKRVSKVALNDVTDDPVSLVTFMSYKDDIDYNGSEFVKLSTCSKNCQNKGVFAKNDLENMFLNGYNRCPLCQEPYDLRNIPNTPPFGVMNWHIHNDGNLKWHKITFDLIHNTYEKTLVAYYPVSEDGTLSLWLIKEAWKNGKLFTMGTIVTTGSYGIILNGIQLQTSESDIKNFGYSSNPIRDMKKILTNLINQCNSFGIYSPTQLDDFAGVDSENTSRTMSLHKAGTLIKELLIKRQTNLSDLRKQHKQRLVSLSEKEHEYFREYVWGILMDVVKWRKITKDTRDKLLTNNTINIQFHQRRVDFIEKKWETDYPDWHKTIVNVIPNYIVTLSKIISEFPRTTKPFYVYRGVDMNTTSPSKPHHSINPLPFSTSLRAWFALSFAKLENNKCCLYRIKIDPTVPCIILGDTPFDVVKQSQKAGKKIEKGNVGFVEQYEVLLAPGILKEKSRKISHKIRDKDEYDRLNRNFDKKTMGHCLPAPMMRTGVLMIDVEYIPLYSSLVDDTSKYEIKVSRIT